MTRILRSRLPLRGHFWALALLVWIPGSLLALKYGFRGLYGQDAYAYYAYATGPLRESLRTWQPLPPFSWPPGYPLLVGLLSLVIGMTPLAGQLLSLIAGGLVPVLTAFTAAEWAPRRNRARVAVLAGLFAGANGQLWQSSIVVMSDTMALAAGTLGVWALLRYEKRLQGKWLALAAGSLALAVVTRLAYWLVAIPAAIYALSVLLDQPHRQSLKHALASLAVAAIMLIPVLGPTMASLVDTAQEYVVFARAGEVYRWHPFTALRRVHETADGLLSYRLPNGLYYAIAPLRSFYLSPLLAVLVVPGIYTAARLRSMRANKRFKRAPWQLLLAWATSIYLFHAGTAWQNFRFTLAYLPPLAIMAALGAVVTHDFLKERFAHGTWLKKLSTLWVLAGLVWTMIGGLRLTGAFIETMQANLETVKWVEQQVPSRAHLIAFGLALTFEHESDLQTHNIFFQTEQDLQALVFGDAPVYLLLNVANIETQWAGRTPGDNFLWLRQGPGLTKVGQRGDYTLFVVGKGITS